MGEAAAVLRNGCGGYGRRQRLVVVVAATSTRQQPGLNWLKAAFLLKTARQRSPDALMHGA